MPTPSLTAPKAHSVFGGLTFVLAAEDINLSAFNASWLFQAGVFKPDELIGSPMITPAIIAVQAKTFALGMFPNRIQLQFVSDNPDLLEDPLKRVLGGILTGFPALQFKALGINFDYFVTPDDRSSFRSWNRRFFAANFAQSMCKNEDPNYCFGSYFSHDFEGFRMKIDAKPTKQVMSQVPAINKLLQTHPEWMHMSYNFHMDIQPTNAAAQILTILPKWRIAAEYARSIANQLRDSV